MSYDIIEKCRFCNKLTEDVIHMGDSFPLAGGFMRDTNEFQEEKLYPLNLSFCKDCCLLQCKEIIHSDILFKKGYFYYSSMIPMLRAHFSEYAYTLAQKYTNTSECLVVEMGCNDGVFLRPLQQNGFRVVGVDPSNTVEKLIDDGFKIYNTYFNESLAQKMVDENGRFDIFLSSNSFAHIDDMKSIMKGIKKVLKNDGLAIIEVHYSKTIIDELQFDFIYHEHMSYYNITSFYKIAQLFDMTLEYVEFLKIHGSSIRVYLRNNVSPLSEFVKNVIKDEKRLTDISIYNDFNIKMQSWKQNMIDLLSRYKGKKIYGYGSSGRSNIILRVLDLHLDAIIDDAPSKIGTYTPVYHLCIKPSSYIQENPPDVIIILAWAYKDDIIKKLNSIYSGKYIIPLPNIEII